MIDRVVSCREIQLRCPKVATLSSVRSRNNLKLSTSSETLYPFLETQSSLIVVLVQRLKPAEHQPRPNLDAGVEQGDSATSEMEIFGSKRTNTSFQPGSSANGWPSFARRKLKFAVRRQYCHVSATVPPRPDAFLVALCAFAACTSATVPSLCASFPELRERERERDSARRRPRRPSKCAGAKKTCLEYLSASSEIRPVKVVDKLSRGESK